MSEPTRARVLHCWKDEKEWIEETYGYLSETYVEWMVEHWADDKPGGTCLLPDNHEGPHVWTPDDQITVRFEPTT